MSVKTNIIREYKEENATTTQLSRRYKIDRDIVLRWLKEADVYSRNRGAGRRKGSRSGPVFCRKRAKGQTGKTYADYILKSKDFKEAEKMDIINTYNRLK